MAYKHGIYVTETSAALTEPDSSDLQPQVIVGTAPIFLADDPAAAFGKPILCKTRADAVAALGYSDDWSAFTLCQSISACFDLFSVAPVIFINVLDPNNTAHTTKNLASTLTPSNGAAVYDKDYVLLSSMVVKTGETTTLVLGTDYSLAFNSAGKVVITLISTAAKAATSLSVTSTSLKPSGVTAADIIGAVDATTGAETGLKLLRQVYPRFGYTAGLILAPGWSQDSTVAAALQAACEDVNGCFEAECLIDIDSTASGAVLYTGVAAQKDKQQITSEHAIALWPKVKSSAGKTYDYSAVYGALLSSGDAANDGTPGTADNQSLSGTNIKIASTVLSTGTEVLLDQEQGNVVNAGGVVTAISQGGFVTWGSNTATYPTVTTAKDRWISVRRFFTFWANSFIRKYRMKVGNSANYRLIESIVDAENIRGNAFVANGYCAKAEIRFSEADNPIESILAGKICFRMVLARYTPAEDIELTLTFDPNALASALSGGEGA